jgi:hypothetical protein
VVCQNPVRAENGDSFSPRPEREACPRSRIVLGTAKVLLCGDVCAKAAYLYYENLSRLGSAIVAVVQPAESVMRQDGTRGSGTASKVRRFLRQLEMRAVFVVVADVFREQPFQMAFIQPDNVIQQIASAAFDPRLRNTILPGTFEGGPHRAHLQRSNGYGNLQPVLCVPVEDQKPGSRFKRKCFPQLLDDPHVRRMPGDIEMQDAPTTVADDEEAVEQAPRK